jgi:glycosyltransferase involved in cell wall biosynthesis
MQELGDCSMNDSPLISVIMATYNSSAFLAEAVASLQRQTMHDWELIAVDDASQDESPAMIQAMSKTDPRIGLLRMPKNSGAGAARDFAIKHAQGTYIAVFDADDVCMPDRFEKQVAFLKTHPEVIAVGTQTIQVNVEGKPTGTKTFPTDPDILYRMMYTAIPIQLPTLMVNTSRLPPDFTWFEGWRYSEDSLLFFKLTQYGKIANLPDFLLQYRYHPQSTSFRKAKTYFYETWKSRGIARRQYHYKPSIRARFVSGLQFSVVTCLPGRCIPWVYKTVRRLMLLISGHKTQ